MTPLLFVIFATLLGLARNTCATGPPPPCFSDIYCYGPLLHTVQMAKIYEDSKTFVDMKMRLPPKETMEKYVDFMNKTNNEPSKQQVRAFVNDNFEAAGQEFEEWIPTDWKPDPAFANKIADVELRNWSLHLNDIWKELGRKMKDSVKEDEELYSIIWVPHPVIVPGGRFREFYYWDSYWIVQGLLLSEMTHTVKGMLENFLYIVDKIGHIPNGGRVYYLERSQPPLLIPMIKSYMDYTGDVQFLADNIQLMEKEYNYWITNHMTEVEIDGTKYKVGVYGDKSYGPRPESYSEDVDSAAIFKESEQKEEFYAQLKAAAESGWDFSSRYFILNGTNKGNLTNIKTRSIVPVDLNSILYWNCNLLAEFYKLLNNNEKVAYYENESEKWIRAVTAVLWHEEVGAWLDYDMSNSIKRDYFYPSNVAPLWTGCYNKTDEKKIVPLVMKYLQNKNVDIYPGGVPTTLEHTGEQWDYPNAWPPLQHMVIIGLSNTENEAAKQLAQDIAKNWVRSNYQAYNDTKNMYEKYDATVFGGHGTGGEYDVQLGFGWTNGIIMDLLNRYGSNIYLTTKTVSAASIQDIPKSSPIVADSPTSTSAISQMATPIIALIISLFAGFIGISIYKKRSSGPVTDNRKRPTRAKYTELKNVQRRTKYLR